MVKGDRLQEGLGAQARPAREQALQMGGAEACLIRQGIERGLVAPVFRNECQRVFDQVIIMCLLFHDPNLMPLKPQNHPFLAQRASRQGYFTLPKRNRAKSICWSKSLSAKSCNFAGICSN